MTDAPERPPAALTHLARERAAARAARDFARADAIRAEIEAAGWKVVDRAGGGSALERATPADILEGPEPRYGASSRVPSRLDEPSTAAFSVIVVAEDDADVFDLLDVLGRTAPPPTQVVVVMNGPSPDVEAALDPTAPARAAIGRLSVEVVRTSGRLGAAAALNAGIRRAIGDVIVLADANATPTGDALTPLASVLADRSVAVAGPFGLRSSDLRHFERSDARDVAAIDGGWLAFRRADARRLGPLDEYFVAPRHLDEWWSLRLRAGQPGDEPRRAVTVELPIAADDPGDRDAAEGDDPERARLEKRNAYRLLDAFRDRPDLAVG